MATAGEEFPRADRLRRGSEFRGVARGGGRAAGSCFVVVVAPSPRKDHRPQPGARLGLTVSRRVGGAVVRNRVKRRVREWFRRNRTSLPGGIDLVVIARRGAGELDGREVAGVLGPLTALAARHTA